MARTPFKMKYANSAFPFKSPLKQGNQLFDVIDDGATAADIETVHERAVRSHAPLGDAVDILRRRKGNITPPTDEKIKESMEYSTKHGHRKPTHWEDILMDFTGKSAYATVTGPKIPNLPKHQRPTITLPAGGKSRIQM